MATVVIKVAGTDYTADVVFATARFASAVNGTVGDCKFRVRDDDRTITFVLGSTIELLVDGSPVWTGFLVKAERVYAFPAENVDDAGLTRWIDITGADLNTLFNKRIVRKTSDPAVVLGTLFPAYTDDSTAIADLVANFLDLSGDSIDTTTKVETVGQINADQKARAWSGSYTWGQAMASIAMLPAAVYFIDPARYLVYTDVNTASAAFGLSDQPDGVTSVGYREMKVLVDGSSLANDVLAWGMGYGSQTPVFKRDTDATSLATHGRWQAGVVRNGIYKQATIDRVADSIINGSPSSQRGAKDDRTAVTLVTYVPGFLPAQKVDFTSNVLGFSDVIPIRRMVVTFDNPTTPKYELSLSHAIDAPWGFFDQYLLHFRLPPPILPHLPGCTAVFDDPFDRTVVGSWGNSPLPLISTWVPTFNSGGPTDIAYSVNGTQGLIEYLTGVSLIVRNNIDISAAPWVDAQWTLSWQVTFTGTSVVSQVAVLGFGGSWLAGIDFALLSAGPFITLRLTYLGHTIATSVPFGGWSSATYNYKVMLDFANGVLLGRYWLASDAEPDTWQMTVNLSSWSFGTLTPSLLPTDQITVLNQDGDAGATVAFDFIRLDCTGLSASMFSSGTGGQACEDGIRTSATHYAIVGTFVPDSTQVWHNGLLQRRGADYTENVDGVSIDFTSAVGIDDPVRICYRMAVLG